MSNQYIIAFLILFTLKYCFSATDLTYTAAVVEFKPFSHDSSITYEELCEKNVREYVEIIRGSNQSLDIVVFPEATITTLGAFSNRKVLIDIAVNIPTIADNTINPCEFGDYPQYIKNISCAAQEFSTYIVINTVEKIKCTEDVERNEEKCEKTWNLYNANLVFDRNGNVIAKYRKYHLFNEPQNCVTKNSELVTFHTDFDVTFGTFICFDILFEEPSLTLVDRGVQHFVYPTMWFAEVPFLTALQAQCMWSISNNVVLLAANANSFDRGSGGSGIHQNSKSNMAIVAKGGKKLIVAEVYKDLNYDKNNIDLIDEDVDEIDKKGVEMDEFKLHKDNLTPYASYEINENTNSTYCHKNFCCHLNIELEKQPAKSENYYRYKIFIFSGVRSFHGATNGGLEVCAIVFCKNDDLKSCAERIIPYSEIEWPIKFTKIEITATYDVNKRKKQFPNTLLSSLEPIQPGNYEWSAVEDVENGTVERKLKLLTPQSRLLMFGIYGRDYSRDNEQVDVKEENDKDEL